MMSDFVEETGASTGDLRENDASAPGFTLEPDRLFRSHFQHANRLADRAYEQARGAGGLDNEADRTPGAGSASVEVVERDPEQGWLNVRTRAGDWASVRDVAIERSRQDRALGFIGEAGALGETPSHQRATFSDPVPQGLDPTSPESPENGE